MNNFVEETKVVNFDNKPNCCNQSSRNQNKQITRSEIKDENEQKHENDKKSNGNSFSFSSPNNSFGDENLDENCQNQLLKINKTSPDLWTDMTKDLEAIKIKSKKKPVLYEEDLMDVRVNYFRILF